MNDEKEKVNADQKQDTVNEQKPPEGQKAETESAEDKKIETENSSANVVNKDEGGEETKEEVKDDEKDTDDAGEKDGDSKSKRALKKEIKALRDEKASLEEKLTDYDDRYKRMAAEYDNYRKRTAKEREGAYTDAYSDALKEILPVIDNLERALTFADDKSAENDKLTEGVKMTLKQFNEALKKMNVEVIGVKGEKFDPTLHNAVVHASDENAGENEVAEVFQKGYRREGKIIRYAMVKAVN